MLYRNDAIKYAKAFLKACNKLPVKIDRAVLFGSVVTSSRKGNDIDIALFSEDFDKNILKNLDRIGKVAIHFPEMDIHTFSTGEYMADSAMLSEIRKSGIDLIL